MDRNIYFHKYIACLLSDTLSLLRSIVWHKLQYLPRFRDRQYRGANCRSTQEMIRTRNRFGVRCDASPSIGDNWWNW